MSGPVILIIDDDAGTRETLSDILQEKGYNVVAVNTGRDALDRAKTMSFDAVLIDISLPDMDGTGLLSEFNKNFPDTACIIITGHASLNNAINAVREGARGYFVKPLVIEEVLLRINDVLDRQHLQRELAASGERYRRITEAITDYIYTVRVEGNSPVETTHSETCFAVTGYTCQEFADDPYLWIRMVPEEDHGPVLQQAGDILSGQTPKPVEHRIIRKDGEVRWVESSLVPLYGQDGALMTYDGIVRDITKRKRAEDQLQALSVRNRAILAAIPDIIMEVDSNKIYTWANQAGYKFFGDDVLGREASFYFEGEQQTYQIVAPLFRGGEDVIYVESWQRRIDGQKRLLAWWCRVLKDSQGNVTGALSSARDITGQKLAEQERERLTRELMQKNKEMEQVMYVTSHDLRTPLVNIDGFSRELELSVNELISVLRDEGVPEDIREKVTAIVNSDIPEALKYIGISISKMDFLLSGLLKLSRLGRAELKMDSLDMNSLMSELFSFFEGRIKGKGIRLEISDLPSCKGDEDQVFQVFTSLIDNAVKFLDPGRPGIIRVTGYEEAGHSVYCVEDNGIGFATEYQKKIFEIFHQLDPIRIKGEGLGLAIVGRVVERHNGKVWVESVQGRGSKFFVSLPAVPELTREGEMSGKDRTGRLEKAHPGDT